MTDDSVDKSEVLQLGAELQSAAGDLEAAIEAVEAKREEVTLPPSLRLAPIDDPPGTFPGSTVSVETTVENFGDSPARDVELSVETGGATATVDPGSIDQLGARSRQAVAVTLTEVEETQRVKLTAEGAGDTEFESFSVFVTGPTTKLGWVEYAITIVEDLSSFLASELPEDDPGKSGGSNTQGIRNQLETIAATLGRIAADIEREKGPEKQLNNRIDSQVNALGAVENAIEAARGKRLDDEAADEALAEVERAVDALEEAISLPLE